MTLMHEDLVHEHVQRLHEEFAQARGAQDARRARRLAGIRWGWLRASRPARNVTPVAAVAPVAVARNPVTRVGPLDDILLRPLYREQPVRVRADMAGPRSQREHVPAG